MMVFIVNKVLCCQKNYNSGVHFISKFKIVPVYGFLTAKKSKKKNKNKGKSDVQTERAATNDPVDEEDEISLDERKWSTPF